MTGQDPGAIYQNSGRSLCFYGEAVILLTPNRSSKADWQLPTTSRHSRPARTGLAASPNERQLPGAAHYRLNDVIGRKSARLSKQARRVQRVLVERDDQRHHGRFTGIDCQGRPIVVAYNRLGLAPQEASTGSISSTPRRYQ